MDTKDALLLTVFLGVPALAFLGATWYFNKFATKRPGRHVYELAIGSSRFRFTALDIQKVVYLILLYGWLDVFAPSGFAILIALVAAWNIGMARKTISLATPERTHELITKLNLVQTEIGGAQEHIKALAEDIQDKQTQVDDRERSKRELDELIRNKSEEAKGWNEQTETQRQAFLETAVSAMSRESRGTFWWGLVLGFVINILATLSWTLMGNPGKDDILQRFKEVAKALHLG